jgi:hypothetical protein
MAAPVLYISTSLDGRIAGPNERPGNGLGDGGRRLHKSPMTGGGLDFEAVRRSGGVNGQTIATQPGR